MNRRQILLGTVILVLLAGVAALPGDSYAQGPGPQDSAPPTAPLGTAFTYQGQLKSGGAPVNASCGLAFRLYDAAGAGNVVGSPITATVPITGGLFTVNLDFGAVAFAGDARWLGIRVQCPGDPGFTDLGRQALTAAPYASYAPAAGSAPWPGLTGVPAGFADGIDNDTLYSAGFGLNLASATFSVVTSTIQARVSGSCIVGSSIRTINADGTVVCWNDAPLNRAAPPAANVATTVDSAGVVGEHTSITIGADGLPVASYYDYTNSDLKIVHCGDLACSSGNTVTTVDSAGAVGEYNSIAVGTDGLPVISYYDYPNHDLKILHCGNLLCDSGNTATTVDSTGDVGQYTSITIGADGLPVVSYYDAPPNSDLKVLHCGNLLCNSGNTATTVDSTGGTHTSIAVGTDGLPVVSYYDGIAYDLKVLHCGNLLCNSGNTATTVDSAGSVGQYTSITIGADGLPVVSYYDAPPNNDLKVLHCGNRLCDSGNTATTVDSAGSVGQYTSITIGADGLPVVSYSDAGANGDLKVLHCGNLLCNSGNTATTVDSTGNVGQYTSITVGADGLPVVSYFDDLANNDLKVLRCSNLLCLPYWRRR